MSNTIRIKRRASGGTGAPASLQNAELAFNEVGDVLYYGKGTGGAGGTATTVEPIGGKGAFVDLSSTQNVGGAKTFTGAVTFSGTIVVPAPTTGSHAVTRDYVDSLVSGGVVWLAAVRAATTANITLSGTQTIDGIALDVGDRVLVKDQTTGSQNGIYVVASGSWTRATDFDTASQAEISTGKSVFASDGTTNGGTQWTLSTTGTITVGTTALSFTQIGGGQNDTGKNVGASGLGLFIQKVGKDLELRKLTVEAGSGLGVDAPGDLNGSARITISSIPVAKGGTGATDAGTARTNLGLGSAATMMSTDFAATLHTHGNITGAGAIGTTSGVPIITGASGVLQAGSFGTAAGTFCQGNDSRLSDARTPTSHTHGNITNAGAIGSTSGVPIITGASGVLQAGSFGTTAGTFCQGNDSRLSNNQPLDATLTALSGVTVAADQVIYATGADAFTTTALTSFGRSLIDDADASAARTTLGLAIGTNVQAFDATLAALAGVTVAADQVIYSTGADAFAVSGLTSFGRSLIDDANASAARSTLELGSMATQAASAVAITGGTIAGCTIDGGTF